jgi:hypothetical protein
VGSRGATLGWRWRGGFGAVLAWSDLI